MKIILYPHQNKTYNEILLSLEEHKSVLVQADTGYGKSVVIGHLANSTKGRVLILTHRVEILEQNSKWVKGVGVLSSKKNTTLLSDGKTARVVVAMVQTLYARIKKYGISYIGFFDTIILDEAHIDIFKKVTEFYEGSYNFLIGFTATPVIDKTRKFEKDGIDYIQKISFSETYETIVIGATTSQLIESGFLIKETNISLVVPNINQLKESKQNPDGYTNESLNKVFGSKVSIKVLLNALETYCKGKKTLLFNSTTSSNKIILKTLLEEGYNARSYDSVNSSIKERKSIVAWFKSERDAILIGTNVFTTGFDVPDIEAIIMNRATKSLSFYIQIAGRGARPTQEIYKDHFLFIDLGMNIERHGRWSEYRNWKKYFYPTPPVPLKKLDLLEIWECDNCGYYNPRGTLLNINGEIECNSCCKIKSKKITKDKEIIGNLVVHTELPLPSANKIISYTKRIGEDANFAFNLLERRIIQLFLFYNVTSDFYQRKKRKFDERIKKLYVPIYFAIIKSDLKGKRRKLATQVTKIIDKIEKLYL